MYDGYRGWVFRRLVTPRWLGALVLAALFAVACYHLGWWQYDRHLAKAERNERLDEHYRGEAVPLGEVLTPSGLAVQDEWRRVTVTGTYEAGPVFVRGRSLDGEAGLEVLRRIVRQVIQIASIQYPATDIREHTTAAARTCFFIVNKSFGTGKIPKTH